MTSESSKKGRELPAERSTPAGPRLGTAGVSPADSQETAGNQQFLFRLLAAISEAVYASDFEGNILYWNRAAEQFYGWTAEEAIGHSVLDMIEDPAIRGSVVDIMETMRSREHWVRETTVERKDGTRFPAQISLSQFRNEAGEVAGMVAVSSDISQRKQAEHERSLLLSGEQAARLESADAQRRALGMLGLTAALSRASTPEEVARVAIDEGLGVLDVDAGMITLFAPGATELHVAHASGYPTEIVDRWKAGAIPIDHQVPLAQAAKLGEPIWVRSRADMLERFPAMAAYPMVFSEAFAAVPLNTANRSLGTLGLSYRAPRNITDSERTYILTLARLCSQALERAHLFADERDARVAAEEAQERIGLLAQASDIMARSLDMTDTLASIARLLVPRMADWCVVDIVDNQGLPERVTVMHIDPEKVRWADELQSQTQFDPDAPTGLAKVLRNGETEFYPFITDDMLVAAATDEEQLRLIRMVGFSSVLIVPMIARGRTLGAITMVHAESKRHYTAEDLVVAENLSHRAALAVDNAHLYEQAQTHADRMDALATASRAFAEARLDRTAVLETLSHQVSRLVGDTVVIRLPSQDGQWLLPVAVYHPDPEAETALAAVFDEHPLRWSEGITGRVATTGEALILPETSPEELNASIKPAYHLWTEQFGIHGVLIVPMCREQQVVGTIALFRASPGRPYTEEDRQFVQEIADRAALALENAELYHEAKEAVRLREEFLSIASHEIRTPMTTITGFAHLLSHQLAQDTIDASRVDMLSERLLHEAQRLNLIVTDLLDVSRIQQGQLDLRPESCDLAELARQVVERLDAAQDDDTRREIVVLTPTPVSGKWDPTRLDQVLTNLISNALKYSSHGPIQVTVAEDDAVAMLSVRDYGAGIPHDQQARLFDPFVRGDTAHHSSSGAGLGLYITRQIVEGHQGSITLDSDAGAGATFTVRLPRLMTE